jgi:uncharacterized protein
MKKIIAVIAACFFLLPLFARAEPLGQGSQRVFDNAKLMSQSEIDRLEGTIKLLRSQYKMDFVVLTTNDVPTDKSQEYADDFYDNNGFGEGEDLSGILLLIDMNNRLVTVSTTGLMIRYITDARLSTLLDTVAPYLTGGEYGQGAFVALAQVSVYLSNGIPSGQYNQDEEGVIDRYVKPRAVTLGEAAIALLAGLLSGVILFFTVRHTYAMKGSAYKYDLNKNTAVTVTGATDVYLRTQVTRTVRASSSSGGGGFGGLGSSTHRSSGGRVHGGGSRRF